MLVFVFLLQDTNKINVKKGLGKIIVKKGWVKNGWVKSWSGKIGAAIISRSNF